MPSRSFCLKPGEVLSGAGICAGAAGNSQDDLAALTENLVLSFVPIMLNRETGQEDVAAPSGRTRRLARGQALPRPWDVTPGETRSFTLPSTPGAGVDIGPCVSASESPGLKRPRVRCSAQNGILTRDRTAGRGARQKSDILMNNFTHLLKKETKEILL